LTIAAEDPAAVVELTGIDVRFVVPTEKIVSFKEYVLRRLRNQIRNRELWALKDVDLRYARGAGCAGQGDSRNFGRQDSGDRGRGLWRRLVR
jgi:hypothetical protein